MNKSRIMIVESHTPSPYEHDTHKITWIGSKWTQVSECGMYVCVALKAHFKKFHIPRKSWGSLFFHVFKATPHDSNNCNYNYCTMMMIWILWIHNLLGRMWEQFFHAEEFMTMEIQYPFHTSHWYSIHVLFSPRFRAHKY